MNREDANTILHKMSTFLDNNQMMKLQSNVKVSHQKFIG